MLAKNGTVIESTSKIDENNIEILTAALRGITITSVNKPPPTPFLMPEIPSSRKPRIVIERLQQPQFKMDTPKTTLMEMQWKHGPKPTSST